jgi:hypothetical protein
LPRRAAKFASCELPNQCSLCRSEKRAIFATEICYTHSNAKGEAMNGLPLQSIIAIIAGIIILIVPSILNYVVGLYLIIIGILGLLGSKRL